MLKKLALAIAAVGLLMSYGQCRVLHHPRASDEEMQGR
jgi:hypothetical protein